MKKTLPAVIFIFILISFPVIFLEKLINIHEIRIFVASFGIFSPILFVIFVSLNNIIPPLAAMPFWIVSVILFGPIEGFTLSFLGNLLGSSINFYLARKWGRPVISKIAGGASLKEIEKLPQITDPKKLFWMKLVGGAATDYISYAAGFSSISFSSYLIATGISSFPMMLLGFLLISHITLGSVRSAAGNLGIFYLISYASTILLIPLGYFFSKKNTSSKKLL